MKFPSGILPAQSRNSIETIEILEPGVKSVQNYH